MLENNIGQAVFLEGVSGVGKTTMVQALHQRMQSSGYTVRSFLEGDCTNPIDFYGTAYLTMEQYQTLCQEYPDDCALLHHPLNDLIRNYSASKEQAADHVRMLLGCLQNVRSSVFYLSTGDVAGQLSLARANRQQQPPELEEIAFWERRREYVAYVLEQAVPGYRRMNLTISGYDGVLNCVVSSLPG